MAQIEIKLPKMGESIAEATITKWLKVEGDNIEEDDILVQIATDKVDSDIPSPTYGVLNKILVKAGEIAKIGQPLAIIENPDETKIKNQDKTQTTLRPEKITKNPQDRLMEEELIIHSEKNAKPRTDAKSELFISPLVKSIAKKEGISAVDLNNINGSGKNGRITKNDILSYILQIKRNKDFRTTQPSSKEIVYDQKVISYGDSEIIEMDRMRKLIATHMITSKQTSAHVTSFIEADVTNIVKWRNGIKESFEKKEKQKITFTPVFVEVCAKTIKNFPMINVSVDQDNIIVKKNINIGLATALPSGNLIVPVIKNADRLSLKGLVHAVNDLSGRARLSQLKPDEIQGGTFTITNIGTFGNLMGTPIINQPQVAILGTGVIKKKPVVIETDQGDVIAIRYMMYLSLSYDHRVVDGALGGMFIKQFADYLESFDSAREI